MARFKSNSVAGFFCLTGLAALIPAYFLPAFLMANAVDGPQWFSIWSGIQKFYEGGDFFLATLIFAFSVIFPIVKLGLSFLVTLQKPRMPDGLRQKINTFTGWTAKYSMLDVLIIAMLILIVKVDDYVRLVPTVGLYLFCFAIFCSIVANATMEKEIGSAVKSGRKWTWIAFACSVLLAIAGGFHTVRSDGGSITSIEMKPLTKRPVPRTMERLKEVADTYEEKEKKVFSREVIKKVADVIQAVTTDSGVQKQELVVRLERTGGEPIEANAGDVDLSDPEATASWQLPEPVLLKDVEALTLLGQVEYLGFLDSSLSEEALSTVTDPFRKYTRTWYGRIFQFELNGPDDRWQISGVAMLGVGLLASFFFLTRGVCR